MENESKSSQDTATTLKRDMGAAVDEAKSGLQQVSDELRKDADDVVDAAKEQATSIAHEVEGAINARKGNVADTLDGVAGAMRRAADDLGEEHGAGMTRQLASRVAQLSESLRSNDVGALIGQAESFGRRQPAAFLGASALLGFAASRFVIASSHRTHTEAGHGQMDAGHRSTGAATNPNTSGYGQSGYGQSGTGDDRNTPGAGQTGAGRAPNTSGYGATGAGPSPGASGGTLGTSSRTAQTNGGINE